MEFRFRSRKLEALYTQERGARRYARQVVDAFFEVMAIISAAKDERDLYAFKSLRFEKLSGKREGEHSVRLNRQWRLTLRIEAGAEGTAWRSSTSRITTRGRLLGANV